MQGACLILAVLGLGPQQAVAGPEEFRLVRVTIRVLDPQGRPVPGALTRTYSEDWGMLFPRDAGAGVADGEGRYAVTIPVGPYSFFAGPPGDYEVSHPGQGLYVVKGPVDIRDSTEVVLQPDSLIRVKVTTADGALLPVGRLLAGESSHVPVVYMPDAGAVRNGRLDLATSRGYRYHLIAHSFYEEGPVGYFLGQGEVPPGTELWLRADPVSRLARLRVEVYDRNSQPGKATVVFRFPELSIDGPHLAPQVKGAQEYLLTPALFGIWYWMEDERGRCESLTRYLRFREGQEALLRFGGRIDPASLTPLVSTDSGHTEFLIDPKDAFGNHLLKAMDRQDRPRLPLVVLENGQPVHQEDLSHGGTDWWVLSGYTDKVFDRARTLHYALDLELYPLGRYTLRGLVVNSLQWQEAPAGPLVVWAPSGYPTQTAVMADLVKQTAEAQADILGAGPPPQGAIAKAPLFGLQLGDLRFVNPRFPNRSCNGICLDEFLALDGDAIDPARLFVLTHEIGHVMQLSDASPARGSHGWMAGPVVEPDANLMALAARTRLMPPRIARHDMGSMMNWVFVKAWEAGEHVAPRTGHNLVNWYAVRRFGWEPLRRTRRATWMRKGDYERLLGLMGLTWPEAMASALSCFCGQNLSWLYRVADLPVDESRVEAARKALADRRVSLGFPSSRVVLRDPPGTPLSLPLTLANNTEQPLTVRIRQVSPDGREQEREVPLGSEAVLDVPMAAGDMPEGTADLGVEATAPPDLSCRLTFSLRPTTPAALTDGSAIDRAPCLLAARGGALVAWQRGNGLALGRLREDRSLSQVRLVADTGGCDPWPRLVELSDGRLWLAYLASRDHANNVFGRMSADGGVSWQAEQQLTFVKPYVTCGPAMAQDGRGTLWLACSNGLTTSQDGGRTWGAPHPIPEVGNAWLNLVPLASGRMLAMIGYQSLDLSTSGDLGATWALFRTLDAYPRSPGSSTYPYAHLIRGASGRLHLTYGSDRGGESLWYRSSADGGETWGDLVRVATGEDLGDGSSVAEMGDGAVWIAWTRRVGDHSRLMLSTLPPSIDQ